MDKARVERRASPRSQVQGSAYIWYTDLRGKLNAGLARVNDALLEEPRLGALILEDALLIDKLGALNHLLHGPLHGLLGLQRECAC